MPQSDLRQCLIHEVDDPSEEEGAEEEEPLKKEEDKAPLAAGAFIEEGLPSNCLLMVFKHYVVLRSI